MSKREKKITINTKLKFFSILKDTLKYYFKNIFYHIREKKEY